MRAVLLFVLLLTGAGPSRASAQADGWWSAGGEAKVCTNGNSGSCLTL